MPGYPYSPILANSDIVWTDESIDALFETFDLDGNNHVDFKELNRMLRKQAQIAEKLRPGRGSIVGFAPGTGGSLPIRPQSAAY